MPAEVESMAYTNEVPWHGLGTYIAEAPNVKEMIRIAGLNWIVEKRPLVTASKGSDKNWSKFDLPVENFFALTRNTDARVLDVVGDRYIPIQNQQAFEFFTEFVEAGDATMETAGSLRSGRLVWGLADLNKSFKLPGKDEVKGFLLVAAPHEQGKSLIIKLTTIRVVCNNTIALALRETGPEFRMAHRQEFDATMIKNAKQTLGLAREQMNEFEIAAKRLKALKLTTAQVIELCVKVISPEADKADIKDMVTDLESNGTPKIKQIIDIYQSAPGADPGTGWGALNAITYYADHVASRTADKRLSNAWFGRTANLKEDMLEALLAKVA